jgi:hypothetical protein
MISLMGITRRGNDMKVIFFDIPAENGGDNQISKFCDNPLIRVHRSVEITGRRLMVQYENLADTVMSVRIAEYECAALRRYAKIAEKYAGLHTYITLTNEKQRIYTIQAFEHCTEKEADTIMWLAGSKMQHIRAHLIRGEGV